MVILELHPEQLDIWRSSRRSGGNEVYCRLARLPTMRPIGQQGRLKPSPVHPAAGIRNEPIDSAADPAGGEVNSHLIFIGPSRRKRKQKKGQKKKDRPLESVKAFHAFHRIDFKRRSFPPAGVRVRKRQGYGSRSILWTHIGCNSSSHTRPRPPPGKHRGR